MGRINTDTDTDKNIQDFFAKNDQFLQVQFQSAISQTGFDTVTKAHAELLEFTKTMKFADKNFEQARLDWVAILDGLSVNIGFPKLRNVLKQTSNVATYLEDHRSQIDSKKFLSVIKEFSNQELCAEGLGIELSPEIWLETQDVFVQDESEAAALAKSIFAKSGFQAGDPMTFRRSKSGGFFMMSTYLPRAHFIGHGPLNSLFRLSTLAHELGHSTTPRRADLAQEFVLFPQSVSDETLIADEDDSYAYEKIFMDHVAEISADLGLPVETSWRTKLRLRKAIQNNLHLLRNQMNILFFSGAKLNEISDVFVSQMEKINLNFKPEGEWQWLSYATLDQPLSRLGYLRAYAKVFN